MNKFLIATCLWAMAVSAYAAASQEQDKTGTCLERLDEKFTPFKLSSQFSDL